MEAINGPLFSADVSQKLAAYAAQVRQRNANINLVSRKDIEYFETSHLYPSLWVTRWHRWKTFASVLDVGTGAGLPGIPLAIVCPQIEFTLIDAIGKKIKVLTHIIRELSLPNVNVLWTRIEALTDTYDAILGRAVMSFENFSKRTQKNLKRSSKNGGIFYWGGGPAPAGVTDIFDLSPFLPHPRGIGKKIWYLSSQGLQNLY
jgi:16S rRNA (guanine527-N7)-methyltransferase